MYFKGNLIRMFLFPLHLTHKNGLSEQFDVPKIFGAFIMTFFNLSPLLRHRKLHFLKENESNWKSEGQYWWVRHTSSRSYAFAKMASSLADPAGSEGERKISFQRQMANNWQCVVRESSDTWLFAHRAESLSPRCTTELGGLPLRIWVPAFSTRSLCTQAVWKNWNH